MNGSAYISPMTGEVVWARKLGRDLVLDGLAFAREFGAAPLLGFVDRLVAEAPRSGPGNGSGDVLPDFAVGPHVRLAETLAGIAGEGPSRLYIPTDPRNHATILAAARRRFSGRASVVYSDTSGFELLAPNTNKGHALRAVATSLGVERSRVAAIGDGPNDREMLEWAGRSGLLLPFTAMQRDAAPPRSSAGSVFSSSADDGALEAMRAFFPAVDLEAAGAVAASVAA
jgi:hydroxymethylpyrimidine pyrophosphatase-like HAD family hydrolase